MMASLLHIWHLVGAIQAYAAPHDLQECGITLRLTSREVVDSCLERATHLFAIHGGAVLQVGENRVIGACVVVGPVCYLQGLHQEVADCVILGHMEKLRSSSSIKKAAQTDAQDLHM